MRFPRPLAPGDRIGVTAPSSGVGADLRPRLDVAVDHLRRRGYEVVVGECMSGEGITSAPKDARAAELTAMLSDPTIAAVVPPWGGELAIDLLDRLDWDVLAAAEPTWLVGWSDLSTVMLPLTLRLGWASLHSLNLMDTPYDPAPGLAHWLDVASATGPVTQTSPGLYREGWDDYRADPGATTMALDLEGPWRVLGGGGVDVGGVLVGGCLEVLSPLAGTPYGDVPAFGRAHADEGLLVYLEACAAPAPDVARMLHGLRLAGWFDDASGILIGRTAAPDAPGLTQQEAVADALGMLDVPIVLDLEIGHVQPFLPLVNGASARVVADDRRREITQTIGG
ncbi:S66 peptidase family protein [Nocardioides sp. cx-173]|uniref:S66 family peptidase n=1 Tax=Nocardioides sp. cx-173 TaxID=2898796 RepID=UPI001E2B32ED|nr:S66 peptidase family protein [Nocardioides sp. cx-173]MCD4524416.1 LD-carboxypeptidase [Nocardioides sp. cx-173]UGB43097.1 LD-carboxypeptidase [Nocardioides sp. cx-173]